jgi:hypothetical protein
MSDRASLGFGTIGSADLWRKILREKYRERGLNSELLGSIIRRILLTRIMTLSLWPPSTGTPLNMPAFKMECLNA